MTDLIEVEFVKNPCQRCGHSPDVHSFKEENNRGRSVTDQDAMFSCNGQVKEGCDLECPDFLGPALAPAKCPTCGTQRWINWDHDARSGKCENKHLVMTDPETGLLYNCATSN